MTLKGKTANRLFKLLLAGSLLLGGQVFAADGTASLFIDLTDSYARHEVESLAEAGLLAGYENRTFRPTQTVTRAELAKLLALSLGLEENAAAAAAFNDVPETSWYRGYVGALVQAGIAQGVSTVSFAPDTPVTREELTVFFIRAFGLEEEAKQASIEPDFADFADVSEWARPYVALASAMGFAGGMPAADGATSFGPKHPAERQALARLAYEFTEHRAAYLEKARTLVRSPEKADETVVASLAVIDATTIEVTFSSPVGSVTVSDFAFDHGLQVKEALLKDSSDRIVVLTTNGQSPGTVYTLSYNGKNTGISAAGAASPAPAQAGAGGGPRSGGYDGDGGDGGDSAAAEAERIRELFAAGGEIRESLTIRTSGTYGPETGETVVYEKLTLDPGPNGEVSLQNVTFDDSAELEVLSGSENSIKLLQTVVKQLRVNAVNNSGRSVRIEARDGTNVDTVEVRSDAIVESSSLTGKLSTIRLSSTAAGKTLVLKGNVDSDVQVDAPGSTVMLSPPSTGNSLPTRITKLIVNTNSTVSSSPGTTLPKLQVTGTNTSLSVAGEGEIGEVEIDASASGTKLNLGSGANVKTVRADSPVTLDGSADAIVRTQTTGSAQVAVEDSVKATVKEGALRSANAAVDAIYPFTLYSQTLLNRMQQAENAIRLAETADATEIELTYAVSRLEAVAAAVEALVQEVSAAAASLGIQYAAGDSEDSVTRDPVLPLQIADNVAVNWSSSLPAVLSADGTVNRPQEDTPVVLTAALSKNGYAVTKPFPVTVAAKQPDGPEAVAITASVHERYDTFAMTGSHDADGVWKIKLGNATLRDDLSGEAVRVEGLPAGLTYSLAAEPGTDGTVLVVHVSGTSASPVTAAVQASLTVLPKAVQETNRAASEPIAVTIEPAPPAETNTPPVAKTLDILELLTGDDGGQRTFKVSDFATDADPDDRLTIVGVSASTPGIVGFAYDEDRMTVSALAEGSTTLDVTISDSHGATVTVPLTVRVTAPVIFVTGIEVESEITVTGLTYKIPVNILYSNGTKAPLSFGATWSSSDTSVATVISGTLFARSNGVTTITVSYSGVTARIEVTVQDR